MFGKNMGDSEKDIKECSPMHNIENKMSATAAHLPYSMIKLYFMMTS